MDGNLKDVLKSHGKEEKEVPGDGNCLFHTLHHIIKNNDNFKKYEGYTVLQLRQLIVNYIRESRYSLSPVRFIFH